MKHEQDFQKRLERIRSAKTGEGLLVAAKQMALYQRMKYLLKENRNVGV